MLKKILIAGIGIALVILLYVKLMPHGEVVSPLTYFDEFKENEYNLVYEDQRIDVKNPIIFIDGEMYIAYEVAHNYVDDRIFYDEDEGLLTLTTLTTVERLKDGEKSARVNGEPVAVNYSVIHQEGQSYLPATLLTERYHVDIEQGLEEKLFIISDRTATEERAKLKLPTRLRTHPSKDATCIEKLSFGESVVVYSIENGYARVRSHSGIIGYVPEAVLGDHQTIQGGNIEAEAGWPLNPLGETVKLVWDQVSSKAEVDWSSEKYKMIQGSNVISPTWFEFENETGLLVDRGTVSYVKGANEKGYNVWPLMSHNFTNGDLTDVILASTAKRQYVIDQLLKAAQTYGFDGINIDIENIKVETSDVWVQFMRELYPQFKQAGLVVSVDIYMPSEWSTHYERAKIAEVTDYFMVMAYDQHWSGSENAGSVSEIPWVEEGIQKNLQEVQKEKLVLGVPFYTRVWKETSQGLEVKSLSLSAALKRVSDWGVTPIYDVTSGQLYAEKQVEDGLYKIWLEDKDSMLQRMDLINKYGLAGYGGWKLGLETSDIWQALVTIE